MSDTAPALQDPITLHLRGDWGQANMHRMCGWIAQQMGARAPEGSRFAIWNGRGGIDQITALLTGEADITIVTPTAAVRGLYLAGELEGIVALGVLGQRDRLVVAADASLPVSTVSELAAFSDELVVATSPDDGVNLIGFAAHRALSAAGLDPNRLRYCYEEHPYAALRHFREGRANVLIHEAVMTPGWQHIDEQRSVMYLPWGDSVLEAFAAEDWPSATVEAGYLPGLKEDLLTLDFSDFVLLCRNDLDDDVAALAAWCMVKTRGALEAQYRHIPADRSPVTYPIRLESMMQTPLPLHPGAASVYERLKATEPAEDTATYR